MTRSKVARVMIRLALLFVFACGSKSEDPRAAATITISGTKYELKSAAVHGTHVAVSTGSLDCSQVSMDAEVILSHGTLGWTLGGTRFPQVLMAKDDAIKGAMLEIGHGTVELRGSATLAGHQLELAGTITALDCP